MHVKRRVLVLGLGASGRSAANFLMRRGWDIVGVDRNAHTLRELAPALPWYALVSEEDAAGATAHLKPCALLVSSPGIDGGHFLHLRAAEWGIPRTGELELGVQGIVEEGGEHAIVWITGTNGKTTVVSWLEHILRRSSRDVLAAGNIGVPLTSCIEKAREKIIVVEISSFQLETMSRNLFDGAALLNITPNHLDRHATWEEYVELKCKLQSLLKNPTHLLISQTVEEGFSSRLTRPFQTFGTGPSASVEFCKGWVRIDAQRANVSEIVGNRWTFEAGNLCAALGLAATLGLTIHEACRAAGGFKKPKHRLEWVRQEQGVDYYDDSKATSPDAVIQAVNLLGAPILLIAGGVHKGASYEPWIAAFAKRVKCILAIGEAAALIEHDVGSAIAVTRCTNLQDAVRSACALAVSGDKVVLSPGCSSFDMFENYQRRGQAFIEALSQFTTLTKKR